MADASLSQQELVDIDEAYQRQMQDKYESEIAQAKSLEEVSAVEREWSERRNPDGSWSDGWTFPRRKEPLRELTGGEHEDFIFDLEAAGRSAKAKGKDPRDAMAEVVERYGRLRLEPPKRGRSMAEVLREVWR